MLENERRCFGLWITDDIEELDYIRPSIQVLQDFDLALDLHTTAMFSITVGLAQMPRLWVNRCFPERVKIPYPGYSIGCTAVQVIQRAFGHCIHQM